MRLSRVASSTPLVLVLVSCEQSEWCDGWLIQDPGLANTRIDCSNGRNVETEGLEPARQLVLIVLHFLLSSALFALPQWAVCVAVSLGSFAPSPAQLAAEEVGY